ncbi:hypothetical protein F5883DRAFT_500751 [Diaporthe sp. PMI_573]|nr:hypothetical protein F5883DRAFT_500751 [Diaporthaceae sp. PMI_573]
MYLLHWFLATLPLTSLASGQDCYWPNGGQASALKACSVASGNDAAACCFADHYCMTNGLCMSMTEGSWYRGGCTDQQFLQSGCPRICHSREIVGGVPDRHAGVFQCESTSLACISRDNCSKQNFTVGAYRAVMNAALSTDLFNSGATATAFIAPSTSANTEDASATTCTDKQRDSSGISTGAVAGIGVGVGLPLVVAVGVLTFMLIREKRRSGDPQAGDQRRQYYNQPLYINTISQWDKSEGPTTPTTEVSGQLVPHELPDTQRRPELGR